MSDQQYQLFEPLRSEELAALRADIAKRGVMVPIEVDENGAILDGHHRFAIATDLGVPCPKIQRSFDSEGAKREHVLKINLLRRHLGPIAWANAFDRLAEERGIRLGEGGDRKSPATVASDSADELAKELAVSPRTARWRRKLRDDLAEHPDLSEQVNAGEMEAKRAKRVVRERAAEQRAEAVMAAPPALPAALDIRHCSFMDLALEDASVDLIFTDPPYPAEYLPQWSDLAAMAARALKPGHLLIAYSGQFHLPEVIARLGEHLTYVWCGSLVTFGPHNNVQAPKIRSRAKPLLFFSRGAYKPTVWLDDCYQSEGRDKSGHDWQQSVGAARYYIDALTAPGDLVLDPFLGSGTTAEACRDAGRRFIGCDVDPRAVATTLERVA